jgi:two-component system, NtrC family, sensor kinase
MHETLNARSSQVFSPMVPSTRILLVEDEADTLEVTGLLLDACGYEVVGASSPDAGLAAISICPHFDLIIADVCLGSGRSGVGMVEEIRRRGSIAPLIMTSGDLDGALAARGVNALFLPKPYGRLALLAAVRSVCNRHRQTLDELRVPGQVAIVNAPH